MADPDWLTQSMLMHQHRESSKISSLHPHTPLDTQLTSKISTNISAPSPPSTSQIPLSQPGFPFHRLGKSVDYNQRSSVLSSTGTSNTAAVLSSLLSTTLSLRQSGPGLCCAGQPELGKRTF